MNKNNDELAHEFCEQVLDCIDQVKGNLPPYEVGFKLISLGAKILLDCAPNSSTAWRTIMASLEFGLEVHDQEQKEKEDAIL